MSPEQAQGLVDGLDHRTDVYLLGSTLYKMLSGKTPYRMESGNFIAMLQRAKRNQFEPPRQIQGLVPRALEAICLKAMATNPSDRYQKASDLAEDLENWLADEPVVALPEGFLQSTERLLRRHARSAVAGLFILTLGLTGLSWANMAIRAQAKKTLASRVIASDVLDTVAGYIADNRLAQFPNSDPIRIELLNDVVSEIDNYIAATPDDFRLKLDKVKMLTRTANLVGRTDTAKALEVFDRATKVIKESETAVIPPIDRTNWLAAEGDKSYYHAALLIRDGKLEEANTVNQEARSIGERLVKSDPSYAGFGVSKGRSLFQHAELLGRSQDWKESTAAYKAGKDALYPFVKQLIATKEPVLKVDDPTEFSTVAYWMEGTTKQGMRELNFDPSHADESLLEALDASRLVQKYDSGVDGYTYEITILTQLHRIKLDQKQLEEGKKYHQEVSEAIAKSPEKEKYQTTLFEIETTQAARMAEVDIASAESSLQRAQRLRATPKLEELASSDPALGLEMAIRLAIAKLAVAKQQLSLNQAASEQVSAEQVQAIQDELQGLVEQAKKQPWFQSVEYTLGFE
jgi:hypothetical protein